MTAVRESKRPSLGAKKTLPLRLQDRDCQLLFEIFSHKLINRDQIIALGFFNSIPRANYRLKQLVDADLIRRVLAPEYFRTSSSCYAIGNQAISLLVERFDIEAEQLRFHISNTIAVSLFEHTLRIVDVRVDIVKAVRLSNWNLSVWLPELLCRHEYSVRHSSSGQWTHSVIKPDAFVRLTNYEQRRSYLLEVDLGHVSHQKLKQTMSAYARYASGPFQEVYGDNAFQVLIITTGTRRKTQIQETLAEFTFAQVTTFAELKDWLSIQLNRQTGSEVITR